MNESIPQSVLDKINEEAGKYAHEEYEGSHAAVARSAYKAGRLKSIEEIEKLEKELERVKGGLGDLISTASKLWDDLKPIKDGGAMVVVHPAIEQAKELLNK